MAHRDVLLDRPGAADLSIERIADRGVTVVAADQNLGDCANVDGSASFEAKVDDRGCGGVLDARVTGGR
jgi:hypothetical protein